YTTELPVVLPKVLPVLRGGPPRRRLLSVRFVRPTTRESRVNARRVRSAAAVLVFLFAVAGCGTASSSPGAATGNAASAPSHPASTAASSAGQRSAGGKGATLKLTGFLTYDGPFTGYFVCYHDNEPYFELEGQHPYHLDIVVHKM